MDFLKKKKRKEMTKMPPQAGACFGGSCLFHSRLIAKALPVSVSPDCNCSEL